MSKKKVVKQRVPRTIASNTMTEAEFWSFIRSGLRAKSLRWKPVYDAKLANRRPYKGTNKQQKWEYYCELCETWFKDKETIVDHIIPAGSLRCYEDLPDFVRRLFCEKEGLRVLCKSCHKKITNEQRKLKDAE